MAEAELTPPPPPSIRGTADGDWPCSDCGNVNFARRNACNRCSKVRTPISVKKKKLGQEIGKAAAEKSRGLFSADDWQCNKCGNVNWARRQQCNVCNAPKFGEVEERTGFGGGYNDRGVVEYKEHRDDSDDEYDEFGRRKKRKKSSETNDDEDDEPVVEKRHPIKAKEEDEDDEEDDDDDDGDLSKYDLSDWGDVPAKKTRKSRSRSRSRSPREQVTEKRHPVKPKDDDDEGDDDDDDLSKYDLSEWGNVTVKKTSKSRLRSGSPHEKRK